MSAAHTYHMSRDLFSLAIYLHNYLRTLPMATAAAAATIQ